MSTPVYLLIEVTKDGLGMQMSCGGVFSSEALAKARTRKMRSLRWHDSRVTRQRMGVAYKIIPMALDKESTTRLEVQPDLSLDCFWGE